VFRLAWKYTFPVPQSTPIEGSPDLAVPGIAASGLPYADGPAVVEVPPTGPVVVVAGEVVSVTLAVYGEEPANAQVIAS